MDTDELATGMVLFKFIDTELKDTTTTLRNFHNIDNYMMLPYHLHWFNRLESFDV